METQAQTAPLTYNRPWGWKTDAFLQPWFCRHTRRLYTFADLYVGSPTEPRVVNATSFWSGSLSSLSTAGKVHGNDVWSVPCEPANLLKFVGLPLTNEADAVLALELYYQHVVLIPWVTRTAILLKHCSLPGSPVTGLAYADGAAPTSHRLPAMPTTVKRPLPQTYAEILCGITRCEEVSVNTIYADALVFAGYALDHNYIPYSQQLIGAWAICQAKKLPLWYDMRVGKTLASQMAAKHLLKSGAIDHVIVVCPNMNVFSPWVPELLKLRFETAVIDGTSAEDRALLERRLTVYVTNYERLYSRLDDIVECLDLSRTMVILDEASAIKNPSARRTLATQELCTLASYVTLLNGTPMEQGPQDIWSQHHCCDPWGVAFGATFGAFSSEWLLPTGPGKYQVQVKKRLQFEMLLSTNSIRYIRAEADQFSGKDKAFRYVSIRPTRAIFEQTSRIHQGYLVTKDQAGREVSEVMTKCVLRTFGFLREVACGYDKFREEEDGPYIRSRHEIDAKLLWVEAMLSGVPGQPLVIYCEFTEEEQRLKERLTELNIKWSSTRPLMKKVTDRRLPESIPVELWEQIKTAFPTDDAVQAAFHWGGGSVSIPAAIRYNPEILEFVLSLRGVDKNNPELVKAYDKLAKVKALRDRATTEGEHEAAALAYDRVMVRVKQLLATLPGHSKWDSLIERFDRLVDQGMHDPEERARQIDDFNTGKTHVFICKWSQARGFRANREEAHAEGIGDWPAIVSLSPPWSLGQWEQGMDRCIAVDPATGHNVCTLIYALAIKGSIEDHILKALKNKKQVQAALLQDAQRSGYDSFVEKLMEGMADAMLDASEMFDAEEMFNRIMLGVPPYSRLTVSRVRNAIREKFGLKKDEQVTDLIERDNKIREAYESLTKDI